MQDQDRSAEINATAVYCQELSGVMLRAKHQMVEGDHYGATRSLTILRQECYNNNSNSSSSNNNNSSGNHLPPPTLPEVLRSRLEHWLVATTDALLLQVENSVFRY